jgi:hypothetical protein
MPVKFPTRPVTQNSPNQAPTMNPNDGSHISPAVRADLGKLLPEQRAEILRVADSK